MYRSRSAPRRGRRSWRSPSRWSPPGVASRRGSTPASSRRSCLPPPRPGCGTPGRCPSCRTPPRSTYRDCWPRTRTGRSWSTSRFQVSLKLPGPARPTGRGTPGSRPRRNSHRTPASAAAASVSALCRVPMSSARRRWGTRARGCRRVGGTARCAAASRGRLERTCRTRRRPRRRRFRPRRCSGSSARPTTTPRRTPRGPPGRRRPRPREPRGPAPARRSWCKSRRSRCCRRWCPPRGGCPCG